MGQSRGVRLAALVFGIGLASAAGSACADPRPVVIELFTSQGCSSCPPADRLLGELAQRDGVVALGFHVDYWDRLGWKDPLSRRASTDRQRDYARRFTRGTVYTPQLVVDGTSEMVGSDREAVLAALRAARPEAAAPVSFAADRRSVAIGKGAGKGEVLLVRFARHRTTQVKAGENKGRDADDFHGVESLARLG
ncbi:MAG TPA: DUF1223 domain-containing protein, partial [Stellaceae bacterium]|nr:DUF1223 domain-containing protein [Stellaceae bacterium]